METSRTIETKVVEICNADSRIVAVSDSIHVPFRSRHQVLIAKRVRSVAKQANGRKRAFKYRNRVSGGHVSPSISRTIANLNVQVLFVPVYAYVR